MSIRILPKSVADKIAAGEVIERPASVVKELVENSIDAGARRIEVELEAGGAKLLRVVDDGCGVGPDDLPLVFLSHATSKLTTEEDLFSVRTMGFRGEALSSITAVSQARIVSRPHDCDAGCEVRAEGGEVGEAKTCSAPPGTQVEVRNLFYNVPVRRKFLKSPATEMAHVTEAVTRLALAHPEIHFVLTHNDRTVFNLPATDDRARRIGEFFGREIAENIIPVSARQPELEIEGYLLPPSVDRSNTAMQYTYVNGRYVRDRTLFGAVAQGYRGLMMPHRSPVCFLFLTLDPHDVDVNVHPTKIEIRLRHGREVYARLLEAIKETLRQAKLTPQVSISTERAEQPDQKREAIRLAISDFFADRKEAPEKTPRHAATHGPGSAAAPPVRTPLPATGPTAAPQREAPPQVQYGACVQVLDSYLIEEAPEGINVIDQHALHERILYNSMQERLHSGPLNSQRLLVPELVELPKPEFFVVMELKDDLARFGMELEAFGENTIIVRSYPQMLRRFDGRTFFQDLLEELEGPEGVRNVERRLDKLLKLMACRGAIKAGERLSPAQIRNLLEQRAGAGQTDTCPHGRPTAVLITRKELDKQFRRRT